MRTPTLAAIIACAVALAACGGHGPPAPAPNVVNIYNWAGFVGPTTIANFERETGVKVVYDTYESDEILETKLLTGRTNYDIVVPSDPFFERLVHAGVFRKLDPTAFPNLVNMDPATMRELAQADPGNRYGIPYVRVTTGLGYNIDSVRRRLGAERPDSWALLFDPRNAARLQDCGISMVDSPTDVVASALIYLGRDPNSRDPADLQAAGELLMKIRPFIRTIVSVGNIVDLANGNVCLVLGWSGDMVLARYRAQEANNGVKIRYFVPREGGLGGNSILAIPADAPHPEHAVKWINFLLRPDVIADITNNLKYPNPNRASLPLVDAAIKDDPGLYPEAEARAKLHVLQSMPPEYARLLTRFWTRFRTGQ